MVYNSLLDVLNKFPTEQSCIDHLVSLRWQTGSPALVANPLPFTSVRRGIVVEIASAILVSAPARSTRIVPYRCRSGLSLCGYSQTPLKGLALREIGVTQPTAWRMLTRLRRLVADDGGPPPMEEVVEEDGTYVGGRESNKHASKKLRAGRGTAGKTPVIGLRQREGVVRMEVGRTDSFSLTRIVSKNVKVWSTIFTDEHAGYNDLHTLYNHHIIRHSRKEYVRGSAHTNSIESVWAVLKRGFKGVYHHWSKKYMPLYLAEFQARLNMAKMTGGQRLDALLRK